MAERIDLPPTLQGDEKSQLEQMWRYLYQLSESINNNLEAIGGNDLTDTERATMQQILAAAGGGNAQGAASDYETLKSLIIKTADFVQTSLQEYRMKLLGETVASGQFGRYVRQTGLDVEVTPTGITQNYSLREIAEDLKHYEVNAKNYIKTGLLRTVSSIPVYGVAIGKDIVTFSNDGTETYNDGNKVAELTADELSFWQGGEKIAGYTGSRISFYYNNAEVFYIQQGKLYSAQDLELGAGKKVIIGDWSFNDDGLYYKTTDHNEDLYFKIISRDFSQPYDTSVYSCGITERFTLYYDGGQIEEADPNLIIFSTNKKYNKSQQLGINFSARQNYEIIAIATSSKLNITCTELKADSNRQTESKIGSDWTPFHLGYFDAIYYGNLYQQSSRYKKQDIEPMEPVGEKIDQLEPVTFIYKKDQTGKRRAGMIYEDTVKIMPEICTDNGTDRAINYVEMIPMLLKEIQDLRARVKALEER